MLTASVAMPQVAAAPLDHHAQAWGLLTATGHFVPSKRVRWWAEVQPRIELSEQRFNQLLVRAAIGFDVGAGWSLWLGNAWTPSFNPTYRSELRP